MTTESLHQTVPLGSRAPPPRPKPPITYAKAHYQSIAAVEYPKGRNPFGDDDEDETPDLDHIITNPPTSCSDVSSVGTSANTPDNLDLVYAPATSDKRPPRASVSVEAAACRGGSPVNSLSANDSPSKPINPFDTWTPTDENESIENATLQPLIADDVTPTDAGPSLRIAQTVDEGKQTVKEAPGVRATQAISNVGVPKNPFDDLVDSDDENDDKPRDEWSPAPSRASNLPTAGVYPRHRQKRHAPPPPSVHASPSPLTIRAHDPSFKTTSSDCYSSTESHISSEISDNWTRTTFALPCEGGTLSQGHPSPRKDPLECTRQLSVSLDNSLNRRPHLSKGPAPPLPHTEKRQVRAESSTDFVKYDVLRKRIEELSEKVVHVDDALNDASNQLAKIGLNSLHQKKYSRAVEKLQKKRTALVQKQQALKIRLQRQTLEDRHTELEYELRTILAKQEHLRTAEEKAREDELLKMLVDIVEERTKLVEEQVSSGDSSPTDKMRALKNVKQKLRPSVQVTHFSGPSNHDH
ncbi:DUF3585 [Sparganum proliferum]